MTYKFPLKLTETPPYGIKRVWVLEDQNYLNKCIDAIRSDYDAFCTDKGYLVLDVDEEGEVVTIKDETHTIEAYLDWLAHDLSILEIEQLK